jgi:hypothetical protein
MAVRSSRRWDKVRSQDGPSVGWGRDSRAGEHMVVSLHARVSNHESGPLQELTLGSRTVGGWGWGCTGGEETRLWLLPP